MPLHVTADYLKGRRKAEEAAKKFEQEVYWVASLDFSTGENNFCLAPNICSECVDIDRIVL